jgi:hypothetical protein
VRKIKEKESGEFTENWAGNEVHHCTWQKGRHRNQQSISSQLIHYALISLNWSSQEFNGFISKDPKNDTQITRLFRTRMRPSPWDANKQLVLWRSDDVILRIWRTDNNEIIPSLASKVSIEGQFRLWPSGSGGPRTKLPSRGQETSPLKYTNCGVGISLERKVCLLKESLGFRSHLGQTFFHRINSLCPNLQKVLQYRQFGGHCWLALGLYCEGPMDKFWL